MRITAFKKKLYRCHPREEDVPPTLEVCASRRHTHLVPVDPRSLERNVRQAVADKVSGNLAGLWLLVAEHLRLGTWDLLCAWTGQPTERVEPRLALQLVHEAAVCTRGIRAERTLHERGGFELANGLPFVATDVAVHSLLAERTVTQTQALQVALGRIRRAGGDFEGRLLAVDPHRTVSHSRRRMRKRVHCRESRRPFKMAQTFWVLDADTHQPVCFTMGTASRNVSEATPELMDLTEAILQPAPGQTLVVADSEHFTTALIHDIHQRTGLDLLVPLPSRDPYRRQYAAIAPEAFRRHWAGFATVRRSLVVRGHKGPQRRDGQEYPWFVQRFGEHPADWRFTGFLSTRDGDEVDALTRDYPKRWHVEEFFNAHQALGWDRAGTMNLNIRYGQMTLALVAQAVIHPLRKRLGKPYCDWDADHLARGLFHRLEGDVRVSGDTILVTYYNAPAGLRTHYEDLPEQLARANVDPRVPWLYGYKLDFRFR